jgi:hypothetical protein
MALTGYQAIDVAFASPFRVEDSHDGKRYRFAVTHATLVVGTLYALLPDETSGQVTAALADNASTFRVGVALDTTTTGKVARLQTGGPSDLTTGSLSIAVGDGLEVAGGAIADVAAGPPFNAQAFAIGITATTSSTDQYVRLLDREITAST